MGASPFWKVFSKDREYRASFVDAGEAASFIAVLGAGATLRAGHRVADIVWNEGQEDQPAGESYDHVADVAEARLKELRHKSHAQLLNFNRLRNG